MTATDVKISKYNGSLFPFLTRARYAAGMIFRNRAAERSQFFHELARLTGAGISITQAAAVLDRRWRDPSVRLAVASLKAGVRDGQTISAALSPGLTRMEFSIIDAAERGGKLANGFQHLEEYYRLLAEAVVRIRGAMTYPAILLHAAVVLPALVGAVIAQKTAPVVVLTIFSDLLVLWAVLAFGVILWSFLIRRGVRSQWADTLLRRIPMAGRTRDSLALARWSAVMHFQVISGQRISDGLRLAGAATESAGLNTASVYAANSIESGGELGPGLTSQSIFPNEMAGSIAAAEYTGTMDTETLRQSHYWMNESGQKLQSSARFLTGAFYGLVMLFTVLQIFKMAIGYMGMYSGFMKDLGI